MKVKYPEETNALPRKSHYTYKIRKKTSGIENQLITGKNLYSQERLYWTRPVPFKGRSLRGGGKADYLQGGFHLGSQEERRMIYWRNDTRQFSGPSFFRRGKNLREKDNLRKTILRRRQDRRESFGSQKFSPRRGIALKELSQGEERYIYEAALPYL